MRVDIGGLDALGDHGQPEVVTEVDHGVDDRGVGGLLEHVGDEPAVDLELVQREGRQVTEGRLALAEVVKADLHSRVGDPAELDGGPVGIGEDRRLGDLDDQARRVDVRRSAGRG